MKNIQINEGLDYHDLEGQVEPMVSVDEYAANMGKDCDIVTLAFTIRSEQAGNDLVDWFEKGYDWVLDAQVSEGEITNGKHLVFVELERRTTVPEKIIELLEDMNTLTNIPLNDWTIVIEEEEYSPDAAQLGQVMTVSPHQYREEKEVADIDKEKELNVMREAAGLPVKAIYKTDDAEIKAFVALARL
jgi:hypothetical protein